MSNYTISDDTLWMMLREQMQASKQARMAVLMDKNSCGTITKNEYRELSALVEDGQRLTLRKAEAMSLLLDRGYTVSLDDMKPLHQ